MKLKLSHYNKQRILEILKIYREIEKKSLLFNKSSGVYCPDGCGECCNNPDVEVSTLEVLPLAMHLWKTGKALETLEILDTTIDKKAPCIFFKKDERVSWKGRCIVYKYRFLVCRLFGYYKTKDKNGNYTWGACRILKRNYPNIVMNRSEIPAISEYSMRILSLSTDFEGRLLPVNLAVKHAIESIGFDIQNNTGVINEDSCFS